jgi:peptidoglycan/LPS O-acetylase OafA/YrhL
MKNISTSKATLHYLPELDSLRALAVTMTLLAHFSPVEIPYMWYGVPIFFTISGFLITTILLNALNSGANKLVSIKNFMIRRVLRLFPIYYLFLIFFWIAKNHFSLYLWKDEFTPYFFTYTPNFLIHKIGKGSALCFAHLWSLGVEEQFYLFWPWLLLFTSARYRISAIIALISFSLVYIYFNSTTDPEWNVLTFTNFHTLGIGAILGCFYVKRGVAINWLKEKRHLLFTITFFHLLIVLFLFVSTSRFWNLYREISLCMCTFSIVLVSIYGWKGIIGYISRNKQVQYIGTISYGIYLYHMPVPYVYRTVAAKLFPSVLLSPGLFLLVCFSITFVLAALSYKYIETPFLKLKRHFA